MHVYGVHHTFQKKEYKNEGRIHMAMYRNIRLQRRCTCAGAMSCFWSASSPLRICNLILRRQLPGSMKRTPILTLPAPTAVTAITVMPPAAGPATLPSASSHRLLTTSASPWPHTCACPCWHSAPSGQGETPSSRLLRQRRAGPTGLEGPRPWATRFQGHGARGGPNGVYSLERVIFGAKNG